MLKRAVSLMLIGFFAVMCGVVGAPHSALAAMPDFSHMMDWPIKLQDAATPSMEHITDFHNLLLYITVGIVAFVTILLIYVMIRFNARANPTPSTTTHNVVLEVLWTVVPVIILIIIAIPSFKLLFFEARNPEPELTVKVTGHQWNWEYAYPDYGDVSFTANILSDKEIDPAKGQKRLLSTDTPVVLPIDTNIVFDITATDVIHSFAVPAFGIKVDAVPGRTNSTWARITKAGTYYGQCSEICGRGHGFMPIEIKAVPRAEFESWIKEQGGTIPVAQAPAQSQPSPTSEPDSEVAPQSSNPAATAATTPSTTPSAAAVPTAAPTH